MKTTLIYLVSLIFIMNSTKENILSSEQDLLFKKSSQGMNLNRLNLNDSLLYNIQQKVFDAFVQSKITQTDHDIVLLEQALSEMSKLTKNSIVVYWYSYVCFYHSLFYYVKKDNKNSEKVLEDGIKKLNDIGHKTSEHLALLASMEGFSIQFAPGIEAVSVSKNVKEHAQKALELDSFNLRAYYVLGSNDFYTPEQYGGGQKAEGYLKKAIQLDDQTIKSPYLPSWGKNSAYELLIRLYIKRKQWDEAKKYYQQAISLFPNDYMINGLTGELVNH